MPSHLCIGKLIASSLLTLEDDALCRSLTKWWDDDVVRYLPVPCNEMRKLCCEIIGVQRDHGRALEMVDPYHDHHRPFEYTVFTDCFEIKASCSLDLCRHRDVSRRWLTSQLMMTLPSTCRTNAHAAKTAKCPAYNVKRVRTAVYTYRYAATLRVSRCVASTNGKTSCFKRWLAPSSI